MIRLSRPTSAPESAGPALPATRRGRANSLETMMRPRFAIGLTLAVAAFAAAARGASADPGPRLELRRGDRIIIIGNTLAERMQYFGHFETLLQSRFPELELVVRNLGWSADELTLRPRSQGFEDHGHTLFDEK